MITIQQIENKIHFVQNKKVIIDRDFAGIYGLETKRINEAVANNPEKFPDGYIVDLNKEEWEAIRSKVSTLKSSGRGKHGNDYRIKLCLIKAQAQGKKKMRKTVRTVIKGCQNCDLYDLNDFFDFNPRFLSYFNHNNQKNHSSDNECAIWATDTINRLDN